MQVRFLGACQEVGKSCFLVEAGEHKILLDAGVKFGEKRDEYPTLPCSAREIDAVVITHAHLDHSGFLPVLFARGFRGKVYATKPTRDLCQLLLADYLKISKAQHKAVFSNHDLVTCLKHFELMEFWRKKKIFEHVSLSLYRSGHILGAAMARLEHAGKSLLYTGDLSLRDSSLIRGADTELEDSDYLIMEATYGSKKDVLPSLKNASKQLAETIHETNRRGGKTLIPTFGVGRGAEVMVLVDNYIRSGYLKNTPAWLDGMIIKANRIYRQNVLWLKEEIPRRILLAEEDPFKTQNFQVPHSKTRSEVFSEQNGVILATSGMLKGGPSVYYFSKLAEDARNTVLFSGYQAKGTLGRRIEDGDKYVTLPNGRPLDVKLRVASVQLSAHADYRQLMEFLDKIKKPQKIFLVHSDVEKIFEFAEEARRKHYHAVVPELGQQVIL